MKIRLVGAELFHAELQIDTAKLVVAFRHFANPLKDVALAQRDLHTYILGVRCYFLLLKHGYS
jgi:hypothetical protein